MTTDGFLGTRHRFVSALEVGEPEHRHSIELWEYKFPSGDVLPYVEVIETGEHGGRRVVELATAVHALLNLGADEIYVVGNRTVVTVSDR